MTCYITCSHNFYKDLKKTPRHLRYPARNWTTSSRHTWLFKWTLWAAAWLSQPATRLVGFPWDSCHRIRMVSLQKILQIPGWQFAFQITRNSCNFTTRWLRALGRPAAKMRFLRFSGKRWPFRKMASTALVSCHFPLTESISSCNYSNNFGAPLGWLDHLDGPLVENQQHLTLSEGPLRSKELPNVSVIMWILVGRRGTPWFTPPN